MECEGTVTLMDKTEDFEAYSRLSVGAPVEVVATDRVLSELESAGVADLVDDLNIRLSGAIENQQFEVLAGAIRYLGRRVCALEEEIETLKNKVRS